MTAEGQAAYEAYRQFSLGKSLVTGDVLPDWKGLKPEVRAAWRAAADAAAMMATLQPLSEDKTERGA